MSASAAEWSAPFRLVGVSLRRLRQVLRAFAMASWIAAGVLLFVLMRLMRPWRPVHGCLKPFMQPWMRIAGMVIGVRISRVGAVPRCGSLLLANHISWLDIVVIAALQPVRFVAKTEVRRWPIIGLLASAAGTLFLHRGKRDGDNGSQLVREQIAAALAAGETVLIFPEGTTSNGRVVRRFHARLLPPGGPVIPLALAYRGRGADSVPFLGDDDFASSLWRVLSERDLHAHVQYLAPMDSMEPEQAARQARRQIGDALGVVPAVAALPDTPDNRAIATAPHYEPA